VQEEIVTPVRVQRAQTAAELNLAFAHLNSHEEKASTSHSGPKDEPSATVTDLTCTGDGTDSGIDCNVSSTVARSEVASPISGGHEEDYASSELSSTSQDDRDVLSPSKVKS